MKALSVRTRLLLAFWIVLLVCVLAPSTYFHRQLHQVLVDESQKKTASGIVHFHLVSEKSYTVSISE
ncbi:hypothetical protein [Desulfosoma caldarium]|uniref:Uncharacterized protein n=1 Tax=Desulfosoma caldarium TaxID=610254 RepID=A0A3N1UR26_9BACT|nr:hypothetical protein [Desulfosoma caldarium]ROQ90997.1 hypothetical protein EDC27_2273 [Desulfosoma caldarium]